MVHAPVIDPDRYRAVMGRFVTGVTVVTTLEGGSTAAPVPTPDPAATPGPGTATPGPAATPSPGATPVPGLGTAPQPFGTTVNSFTSVSLDPPLVLITIGRERSIHPVLAKAGRFAVNILAEGAQGLSDCFAGAPSPIPRSAFCGATWRPSPAGLPFLDAALAWVECDLERVIEAGDHTIYLGRVTALEASDSNEWPLLYFQRRYLRIEHAEAADLRGKPDKT